MHCSKSSRGLLSSREQGRRRAAGERGDLPRTTLPLGVASQRGLSCAEQKRNIAIYMVTILATIVVILLSCNRQQTNKCQRFWRGGARVAHQVHGGWDRRDVETAITGALTGQVNVG